MTFLILIPVLAFTAKLGVSAPMRDRVGTGGKSAFLSIAPLSIGLGYHRRCVKAWPEERRLCQRHRRDRAGDSVAKWNRPRPSASGRNYFDLIPSRFAPPRRAVQKFILQ
jgi:hypothetical protein